MNWIVKIDNNLIVHYNVIGYLLLMKYFIKIIKSENVMRRIITTVKITDM